MGNGLIRSAREWPWEKKKDVTFFRGSRCKLHDFFKNSFTLYSFIEQVLREIH